MSETLIALYVFVLACFIGYYVVWGVQTCALPILGFFAVLLASINVFGGFLVTHRMLSMFKKKK